MNRQTDNGTDDKIVTRICQTLDREAQVVDQPFEQRLNQVVAAHRHRYMLPVSRKSLLVTSGSFALAASLAAFLLMPPLFSSHSPDAETVIATQAVVDPQFVEDLDMLDTLGDEQAAGN